MASTFKIKIGLLATFSLLFLAWVVSGSLRATAGEANPSLTNRVTEDVQLNDNGELTPVDSQSVPKENACAACHEDIVKKFSTSVHGKVPNAKDIDGSTTCASCHGDGTAHMTDGSAASIKNPKKLSPNEINQTCTTCHSQIGNHAIWRGSKHESAGLSCLSCHSSHHAGEGQPKAIANFANLETETKLLKMRTEKETCYQCHGDLRKSEVQRSTHLFRNEQGQSKQSCSACHNAHGSTGEKLMQSGSLNDTCYECHTEKRGPFLWEHAPATENCANCHKAHGSNNPSLLKARTPMLCQQCHIQGRHQTVPGKPNSVFQFSRGCTTCHSQVHGSNHPSGINLQR